LARDNFNIYFSIIKNVETLFIKVSTFFLALFTTVWRVGKNRHSKSRLNCIIKATMLEDFDGELFTRLGGRESMSGG